jgi:hypothetical protein
MEIEQEVKALYLTKSRQHMRLLHFSHGDHLARPATIEISHYSHTFISVADDTVLIGKDEIEMRQLFVDMENIARKLGLQINKEKPNYMIVERKNSLKQNKIGHLKIKKIANLKQL